MRGQPLRFVPGHNTAKSRAGPVQVYAGPGRSPKLEHVLVAEQALGKLLPPQAVVHHVDGNHRHNVGSNLLICQDQAYHMLIHQRTRCRRLGGNPNTDKVCCVCQRPRPFEDFWRRRNNADGRQNICKDCHRLTRKN